jgi:preprotein translocase subunit SecD
MKTLRELLQDADPVRHEPNQPVLQERARRRDAVISGANSRTTPSTQLWRSRMPLLAAAMLLLATAVVEFYLRAPGTVDLQAAVRFEVRLAEDSPAAGLQAARVGSDRAIYLHPEAIVSNSDVAHARVVPGNSASRFGVGIEFKAAGAQKMRTATAGHFGKPLAILIDGKVVMAPTVRSPIDALAEINGDLTRTEAERIVNGIGIQ